MVPPMQKPITATFPLGRNTSAAAAVSRTIASQSTPGMKPRALAISSAE